MAGNWWGRGTTVGEVQLGNGVAERVQAWLASQKEKERTDSWFVSSLYHLCPRELAMRAVFGHPGAGFRQFEPRLRNRMDVGTALQLWWQNRYLGPAGVLLGTWKCSKCAATVDGKMPKDAHCEGATWAHVETRVTYTEQGWTRQMVGRMDGEVEGEPPDGEVDPFGVLEIKKHGFMPVKTIPADYMWQIQAYMRMRGRRWGIMLFIDASCNYKNEANKALQLPCQEVVVRYDETYWNLACERVRQAEAIVARMAGGTYGYAGQDFTWPDKVCIDRRCKTAERCAFASQCFDSVAMAQAQLRIREGRDPITGGEPAKMPNGRA